MSDIVSVERHIAGQIKDARRRSGLSQADLADRAGVSQACISRLETGGRIPRLETLVNLANACGHDIELRLVLVKPTVFL